MRAKLLLGPVLLCGFFWGLAVLDGSFLWVGLKSIYGVVFWAYPLLLAIDLLWSFLGKNQRLMNEFYNSISIDLIGIFGGYAILMTIYLMGGNRYDSSALDLAATGLPLALMAAFRLLLITKEKMNGKRVKPGVLLLSAATVTIFLVTTSTILAEVSGGQLPFAHSLWIQITVFCISLYFYVESAKIHYFVRSGKLAYSTIHKYIFADSDSQIYERTRKKVIEFNNRDKT